MLVNIDGDLLALRSRLGRSKPSEVYKEPRLLCATKNHPGNLRKFRYVFYSLMDRRGDLIVQARGAAQQNLNQNIIRSFEIPTPPLPVQRKIASILSAYDDLIENNTRRIAIFGRDGSGHLPGSGSSTSTSPATRTSTLSIPHSAGFQKAGRL